MNERLKRLNWSVQNNFYKIDILKYNLKKQFTRKKIIKRGGERKGGLNAAIIAREPPVSVCHRKRH